MTRKVSDPETERARVEAYLAHVPEPARTTLERIRATIRAAAPKDVTEGISYGIPAFFYQGPICSYAAFKSHCSFFPMGSAAIEEFAEELEGYRVSKGTIHFALDRPLPAGLVKKMVKACVTRNVARV